MGRYGQKTRPGEAVSGFGVKSSSGGGASRTLGEEIFNSSATWTCPPTVTFVEVVLVSGGGGGGADMGNPSQGHGGGGGGGGVAHSIIPVSGPAPVVIGAGGAGGVYVGPATGPGSPTNPWFPGAVGGTSSFGSPTSPVFFYVEGGGAGQGGGKDPNSSFMDANAGFAPAMGGSGGSLGYPAEATDSGPPAAPNNMTRMNTKSGGKFGNPTYAGGNWVSSGGGQGGPRIQGGSEGIYIETATGTVGWVGAGGMTGEYNSSATHGAGTAGYNWNTAYPNPYYGCSPGSNAVANKGGGGYGGRVRQAFPAPLSPEAPGMSPPLPSGGANGGIGGSGVAIVRYWQ